MKRLATLCLGFVLLGVGIGVAEPVIGSGTPAFEGRVTIQEANEMIFALKEKLKREPEPSPPPPVPAWETPIMTLTENVHPELQYPEPVYRPVTVTKKVSTRPVGKKRSKQKTAKKPADAPKASVAKATNPRPNGAKNRSNPAKPGASAPKKKAASNTGK